MLKSSFIFMLLCVLSFASAYSQSAAKPSSLRTSYHPPSQDKLSFQRLNLNLSSTYILVVKEGQVDFDSCLINASRSLGLSRAAVLGEGIDDPELMTQSQWLDRNDPGKGMMQLSKATGKKRVELLLLLGTYYAFQPQSYYRYRDSVEYFLNAAIKESRILKEKRLARQAVCPLVKMYTQANEAKSCDSVFLPLIKECEAAGDRVTEARAYAYRGIYTNASAATMQNKITDLQKAAAIYHDLKDTEGEINAITDLGYLLVIMGQLQPAHDTFIKALQLEETIHYPYVHYNTDAIAMVQLFMGKFGEPFRFTRQTIKSAEDSRDSIGWAYFYARLSSLYRAEGGREKESGVWRQKALDRFLVDRNSAIYNVLLDHINDASTPAEWQRAFELITDVSKKVKPVSFTDQFFYHMVFANCYINLRQFDDGAEHLAIADSMETQAEQIRGPLRRAWIFSQYGMMAQFKGDYRGARNYLEQYLLTRSPASRRAEDDLYVYRNLMTLDSLLHDPVSELTHSKQYSRMLDSNFRVSKIRQAEELQVLYQTEEKEKQIGLLNEQAKLEQTNLKQATLVKNLTIAGIVGALIIAGLLYRQNRLKQRNNNVMTRNNEQLQNFLSEKEWMLTEKEWLLKEIHHRVKNNLQIVMSLLSSQSEYIENGPALTAIQDSQHRVQAMSLLHQKLYISESVSSIDMDVYIRELVSYLTDGFSTGQRIRFDFAIEQVEMDVSQAVPLGLILNEAITNSIKYAFPDGRRGLISISLSTTTAHHYLLVISDNGIGIDPDANSKRSGSLGMSLIVGLTEDLGGNLVIESNGGTTLKITFVHDLGLKRPGQLTTVFVPNN